MALQNNLIGTADIGYGAYQGSGKVTEFKFTITTADLAALGAFTTGDVILINIPANSYLTHTFIKHSVPVAGPSISACTAQVQTATAARGGTALNVFAAASATAYDIWIPITEAQVKEATLASATPVFVHIAATGANLSVVTAGTIGVTIGYRVFAPAICSQDMITQLITLLIVALVLFIIYFAVGKFVGGTVLQIIGIILGLILLLYALRMFGIVSI